MRCFFLLVILADVELPSGVLADQIVAPSADGTLVDGGGYGNFDGIADSADWSFNQSSYEGAITVSHEPASQVEHRLVFEFNLVSVSNLSPVSARLKFKLRGAPRFPAESAVVQVFSYPSDLVETLADFSAGPTELLGQVEVAPFQAQTLFEIDVTDQVNQALLSTAKRIAIRLQLDPQTQSAQAFLDGLDSDPTTKPSIVVSDAIASDLDHDGDIDARDYSILVSCMNGPGVTPPAGCTGSDLDGDMDVDLTDLRFLEEQHSAYRH